jgi:heat shock protein HtpX
VLRILLFTATNFAIMIVISVVWSLLGLDKMLLNSGISVGIVQVLPFALAFGMGGSIVSLLISKWMAIRSTGAQLITDPSNKVERWLVDTVAKQAEAAGIGMPDVAVFQSAQPNAFATGASRNNALVAVSTGLLHNMSQNEVEAVLAHEVSHVANGDMVTMTLLQGILNTFVLIFSRVIGQTIDQVVFKSKGRGIGYFVGTMVAQVALSFLAQIIVMWFSRYREHRADEGGARLAGKANMIAALVRLETQQPADKAIGLPDDVAAMGILGAGGLSKLFMSHPPIGERIAHLQNLG